MPENPFSDLAPPEYETEPTMSAPLLYQLFAKLRGQTAEPWTASQYGMGLTGGGVRKAIGPGSYAKLPDTMMGFTKNPGPFAASFYEQKYPFELPVQVQIKGIDPWEDAVKGLNFQHALARALRNWPGASIVPLRQR